MSQNYDQPVHHDYLDFDLEIGPRKGRTYPVGVRSPVGEARGEMRFPYTKQTLENRLQALELVLLRSSGRRRGALSQEEQTVQEFGRVLFDALLADGIRSRYEACLERAWREGKEVRLRLRIQPPELAALPWEFLYDPGQREFACLSNTSIIRYLDVPRPVQPLTVSPPLRVLGMVATPKGTAQLDVENEQQRVEAALKDLRAAKLVDLTWLEGQTWRHLQKAMRGGPWHIFHFIGHGRYDTTAGDGHIVLANENGQPHELSATALGRLLDNHRSLKLVLLNSCEGARGSEADIFSSTAATLVSKGIPAVIAMQYEITDTAAIEFSRTFYEMVAEGLPIEAAVAQARESISMALPNSVEWGTPVLYTRAPDGVLFRLSPLRLPQMPADATDAAALTGVAPVPSATPPSPQDGNDGDVPREPTTQLDSALPPRSQQQEKVTEKTVSQHIAEVFAKLGEAEERQEWGTMVALGQSILVLDANHAPTRTKVANAYRKRGVNYYNNGSYDEAIADFTNAIELDPSLAKAYTNRGSSYSNKGNNNQAIADHTKAIELDPSLAVAYANRAASYAEQRNYDPAIADATKAIELDPSSAKAYYNRGICYQAKKAKDAALQDFRRAAELGYAAAKKELPWWERW